VQTSPLSINNNETSKEERPSRGGRRRKGKNPGPTNGHKHRDTKQETRVTKPTPETKKTERPEQVKIRRNWGDCLFSQQHQVSIAIDVLASGCTTPP
jgi:hypothetical protein